MTLRTIGALEPILEVLVNDLRIAFLKIRRISLPPSIEELEGTDRKTRGNNTRAHDWQGGQVSLFEGTANDIRR